MQPPAPGFTTKSSPNFNHHPTFPTLTRSNPCSNTSPPQLAKILPPTSPPLLHPPFPHPEPLNNLSNDLQRANNTALPLRQTHKTLSLLKSPPDLPDPSPLSALIDALTSANIPHTHTLTLQSPPELPDPSPLIALIDALTSANIPHTPPIHLSNPPDLHDPHTIDTLQTLIDTLDHAQTEATRASTTHAHTSAHGSSSPPNSKPSPLATAAPPAATPSPSPNPPNTKSLINPHQPHRRNPILHRLHIHHQIMPTHTIQPLRDRTTPARDI